MVVPLSNMTAYRIIQIGDRFQVVMQDGASITGVLMGFTSEAEASRVLDEYLRLLGSPRGSAIAPFAPSVIKHSASP
jgi:hypothetical protein